MKKKQQVLVNVTGAFFVNEGLVYFESNSDGSVVLIDEHSETSEQAQEKADQLNAIIAV